MMFGSIAKRLAKRISVLMFDINQRRSGQSRILLSFLFHNLFSDVAEMSLNEMHPQQRLTVNDFRQFAESFLTDGYRFVAPNDLIHNTHLDRKNALITFDDGYASSLRALPVLEEFNVPAIFFVVTNNTKQDRLFWWDVLYRERRKRGTLDKDISAEEQWLHFKRHDVVHQYLIREFGEDALWQTNDLNRPLKSDELKQLSRHKLITIGNHTADHVHLPLYSKEEIKGQIENAQRDISEITGEKPCMISYPYGDCNDMAAELSKEAGLVLGITLDAKCDRLPLDSNGSDPMRLGRFLFRGNEDQCIDIETFQPDMRLFLKARQMNERIAKWTR